MDNLASLQDKSNYWNTPRPVLLFLLLQEQKTERDWYSNCSWICLAKFSIAHLVPEKSIGISVSFNSLGTATLLLLRDAQGTPPVKTVTRQKGPLTIL